MHSLPKTSWEENVAPTSFKTTLLYKQTLKVAMLLQEASHNTDVLVKQEVIGQTQVLHWCRQRGWTAKPMMLPSRSWSFATTRHC
jgi:hypothetical protein